MPHPGPDLDIGLDMTLTVMWAFRDAVKGLHGETLHGSVLRIEISANNKNKLGPRGGYRERKELSYEGRASARYMLDARPARLVRLANNLC